MSEGPISRERLATTMPPVSIPDAQRVCARRPGSGTGECGRKRSALADSPAAVTCPECKAAIRADSETYGGTPK